MRSLILAAGLALLAVPAPADTIRNACLGSERAAGNRALCTCIQAAADRTLSRRDQRLAAQFFRDPDRAQEIRSSDTRAHDAFWERYTQFGAFAEAYCAN